MNKALSDYFNSVDAGVTIAYNRLGSFQQQVNSGRKSKVEKQCTFQPTPELVGSCLLKDPSLWINAFSKSQHFQRYIPTYVHSSSGVKELRTILNTLSQNGLNLLAHHIENMRQEVLAERKQRHKQKLETFVESCFL